MVCLCGWIRLARAHPSFIQTACFTWNSRATQTIYLARKVSKFMISSVILLASLVLREPSAWKIAMITYSNSRSVHWKIWSRQILSHTKPLVILGCERGWAFARCACVPIWNRFAWECFGKVWQTHSTGESFWLLQKTFQNHLNWYVAAQSDELTIQCTVFHSSMWVLQYITHNNTCHLK